MVAGSYEVIGARVGIFTAAHDARVVTGLTAGWSTRRRVIATQHGRISRRSCSIRSTMSDQI